MVECDIPVRTDYGSIDKSVRLRREAIKASNNGRTGSCRGVGSDYRNLVHGKYRGFLGMHLIVYTHLVCKALASDDACLRSPGIVKLDQVLVCRTVKISVSNNRRGRTCNEDSDESVLDSFALAIGERDHRVDNVTVLGRG